MFEAIASKLHAVMERLGRRGVLTEKHVREAMREVRLALLEADVNFRVVRDFINEVTEKAVGEKVLKSITPGQQVVKIVYDALTEMMGPADPTVHLAPEPPTVIMLAGLQGSGKTTTAAKLASLLRHRGHHPMLVAADIKRPAAIEQLEILGKQLEVPVFARRDGTAAPKICRLAVAEARKQGLDVVILDTAGRLHIDEEMMAEIADVVRRARPHQTYLVADAMTGQDAVASASEFHKVLPLDGVILTKLDADARGGAALSIRAVTGRPIKFVGVGERLEALEEFHPDRMAGRILGMGDVVTLVEKAQATMNAEEAKQLEEKFRKATFTLEDFLKQIRQMRRIGPFKDLLAMIPGCHHPVYDCGRAGPAGGHRRQPTATHRPGQWHLAARGLGTGQAVQADAWYDEGTGRWLTLQGGHGHAGHVEVDGRGAGQDQKAKQTTKGQTQAEEEHEEEVNESGSPNSTATDGSSAPALLPDRRLRCSHTP